ncbi:hypothetical protein SLS62_011317 [Diatrype stigma]|uniref:Uncharacterized protein n=1 Tax=Diatrype stigma TaxID=117547 RepID=A0AAN9U4M1_9PEZI
MVSFFGLRIGGERKKPAAKHLRKTDKNDKTDKAAAGVTAVATPQKCQTFDQAVMRESKTMGKDSEDAGADPARPSSSRSHKVRKRRPTDLPYDFDNTLKAIGLPEPHKFGDGSYPSLRGHSSNPNLVSEWKNGSTPNLVAPSRAVVEQVTRPRTSSREKPQLYSIDIPAAQEAATEPFPVLVASPQSITSATPKSPLGNMELPLNLPNEGAVLFREGEGENVLRPPEPLRIIKKSPSDSQLGPPPNPPPAGKPPSPPQSIRTDELDHRSGAILSSGATKAASSATPTQSQTEEETDCDRRRASSTSSTTSQRVVSADLDNEFRELSEELHYGPKSIPSPPASLRRVGMGRSKSSDDKGIDSNADGDHDDTLLFFEGLGAPIIRTVQAKRDTLTNTTINSMERRASVETLVEKTAALGSAFGPGPEDAPRQPPPKSSARAARPAALDLNLGLRPSTADQNSSNNNGGPRSAPFPVNRPPWTPTLGQSPLAYSNYVNRAPSAAGSSRLVPLRLSRDSFEFDLTSPHSPESPVIPLSGPLASNSNTSHVSSPAGSVHVQAQVQARKMTPTPSPAPDIISPVRRCHTDAELLRAETDSESEYEDEDEDPEERMRNFRFPDFSSLPASAATSPVMEKFPSLGRPSPLAKLQQQLQQQHQEGEMSNSTTTKTPAPAPRAAAAATRRAPSNSSPPNPNPTPTPKSSSSPFSPASPFTPAEPFPAFSPLKRVATAPNDRLSNWPLPSPTMAKMASVTRTGTAPAAPTTSAALGGAAAARGAVELGALELEPLEPPPRMPAALAESKTSRMRSFSRPWTPNNEPLKFEITPSTATGAAAAASPVIRTQTVMSPPQPLTSSAMSSPRSRSQGQSPRTQAPPPRSPPVAATAVDRGLRSPGIVGDDFGGGFI